MALFPLHSRLAIWTFSPDCSDAAAQSSSTLSLDRPMTDTIPESTASDAAYIASPRAFVTFTPSAKEMASAKQRAEYSPRLNPMAQVAASTASCPCSCLSFSTAAMDATKMACAAGTVLHTSSHMPTNWAPWPGNMNDTYLV